MIFKAAEQSWRSTLQKVADAHVLERCSRHERELMIAPVGAWSHKDVIDASWRMESVAVLVWALGLRDVIPPYDQQMDLKDGLNSAVGTPRMRPGAEIIAARDLAELDFPAFGKPYALISDEEWQIATSIAQERHAAFNWLCGYSDDWDQVPTDT